MIYCDGFHNKKNGTGFTIVNDKGEVLSHTKLPRETNNGSELWGIYKAVVLSEIGGDVITDSQVCLAWMKKGKAGARPDLDRIVQLVNRLREEKRVRVRWMPRNQNKAGLWNERSC